MDAQSPQTKPVIDLSKILVPDVMIPILADPKVQERLKPFLPSGGDDSKSTEEELRETLLSQSFHLAMVSFSSALASGRLGDTLAEFDLPEAAVTAARKGDVEAFAIAMEEDAQARKNIEAVAAEEGQEDAAEADATAAGDAQKDKTNPEAIAIADRGDAKKDAYAEAVAKTTQKEVAAEATQEEAKEAKEDGDVQAIAEATHEEAKEDGDVQAIAEAMQEDAKKGDDDAKRGDEAVANAAQKDKQVIIASHSIRLKLDQPRIQIMKDLSAGMKHLLDLTKANQEKAKKEDGSVEVVVTAPQEDAPKEEGSDALLAAVTQEFVVSKDEGSSVDPVALQPNENAPEASSDGVANVIKEDDDCSVVKRSEQGESQI